MIFYFSATGNSKYVASRISKSSGDEIFAIDQCLKNDNLNFIAKDNENIGIVVPAFTSALPIIVDEFFNKANLSRDGKGYNFAVITYGTNSGAADYYLQKSMKENLLTLDALFSIKYPDSFAPLFNVSNKEKMQKKVDEAEPHLDDIINKIKKQTTGNFVRNKTLPGIASLIHKFAYINDRKTTKFIATDACISCGLCAQKCPVDAIEMQNGRPVWVKSHCVLCMGCLHRCPQHAIEYGNTKKHGQYLNPNITI